MGRIRVALAQINVTVGDLEANSDKILQWTEKAKDFGSDIVTFPELCICGYPPEDLVIKRGFLKDNLRTLDRIAERCAGITVLAGFADECEGKVYNAAALIHDGRVADTYRKIELPNYGVFDEKRYFTPGSQCLVFDMNSVRFSVTICEDMWVPGSVTEKCALENSVDAVLNLSASPYHAGKRAVRRSIVARFAEATQTTVFFSNLIGGQDELVFDGASLVVNSEGTVLATAGSFCEDLLIYDLEVEGEDKGANGWNLACTPCDVRQLPALGTGTRVEPTPSPAPELDRLEEIYGALVLGTRDYVRKNGFEKAVIGLSGGIDSALTAAIAVDALGTENVIGVTMPSEYTSSETRSDAQLLAENLGIRFITAALGEIFNQYLDELNTALDEEIRGIAHENIQARIRGTILMGLSNQYGWLVLTTGNKSETAVGYCTLYGDMAGGFAVIKDVPKTLVYELSEFVNDRGGREIIPVSIISRAPSAELKPDQKDQDSLPPYEQLDLILEQYVEQDRSPEEIVDAGFPEEVVREVVRMVFRNEYKRRQGPPGVKITPKAFGRDRRLPITNRYTG